MKGALIIFVVLAIGCASNADMAINSPPTQEAEFSQRADFPSELDRLTNLESLRQLKFKYSDQQKAEWLGYQAARCESLFGMSDITERCISNEARVLRLFSTLPVEQISEDQFLVTLEVFEYYASIQQRRSGYSLAYVNHSEELSESQKNLLLSQSASPLALFIVSLRDVLNEEDETVY
ncbi:hypothetical protein [uncultured Umboniibacter sp.]|uniref:hypothetical protein n=1 Tax=uncultured Umboniibacter sp. TaxID=1798917 RepID=UPI00262BE9D9|nr:hypothetical protein [uncultured Umboniibacter sp.]